MNNSLAGQGLVSEIITLCLRHKNTNHAVYSAHCPRTSAATIHISFQQTAHWAYIRKCSGRGVLIPISRLLFHTVGARACYSSHEESLRSTVLQLPLCNQPLWLFCTQQALIATFRITILTPRCRWHTWVLELSEISVKQGRKWP